jgi:sulfide dehydrogenase cytochrome subunit
LLRAVACVLAASVATSPASADLLATLVQSCEHCHGPNGISTTPDVPIIAGFSREGFVSTMDAFRSGERVPLAFRQPGEQETTMHEIAERLSDSEVQQLAEHFSALPFVAAAQPVDAELAKHGEDIHRKLCAKCHTADGAHPVEDAAILAGQWTPYLRRQFANVQGGRREVPSVMQKRFAMLKPPHIEALLAFYAQVGARGSSP